MLSVLKENDVSSKGVCVYMSVIPAMWKAEIGLQVWGHSRQYSEISFQKLYVTSSLSLSSPSLSFDFGNS